MSSFDTGGAAENRTLVLTVSACGLTASRSLSSP